MNSSRAGLIILDGAGLAVSAPGNVVDRQWMPNLFGLFDRYGMARLDASGPTVGLLDGQAGNSEVGHLTIGLGRREVSAIAKIDQAFGTGDWGQSPVWRRVADACTGGGRLHIVGLLSDAGVHGHWHTITQASELTNGLGLSDVVVHLVLDGVDSPRGSAARLLEELTNALAAYAPAVTMGLVIGRKWFADRSGNYALTSHLVGALCGDFPVPDFSMDALERHCSFQSEDTFPAHFVHQNCVRPNDAVLVTSHRADRAAQAVELLCARAKVFTMVTVANAVPREHQFFPTEQVSGGVAEALLENGIAAVRIAEKCKFPHVTYFFNGFRQSLGERQLCIPDTDGGLDSCPQMRVSEIVEACRQVMTSPNERAFVVNIPNLDQVGHLGDPLLASLAAIAVDDALEKLVDTAAAGNWSLIITADHGNAEELLDSHGQPFGSHTTNPVPLTIVHPDKVIARQVARSGTLENVAATFAELLDASPRAASLAPSLIVQKRVTA